MKKAFAGPSALSSVLLTLRQRPREPNEVAFRVGTAFAENRFSKVCDSFIIPAAPSNDNHESKNVLRSRPQSLLTFFVVLHLSCVLSSSTVSGDCVDSQNLLRLGRITGSRSTKFPPKTMPTGRVRRKFHTARWSNHHYPEPATKTTSNLG